MPDQLSALVPKKKLNRLFLIPEKGVGTILIKKAMQMEWQHSVYAAEEMGDW